MASEHVRARCTDWLRAVQRPYTHLWPTALGGLGQGANMLEVAYLSLVPRSWRQTIQSYPSNTRGAEWRLLDATCELDSRSELKLRTGKSLHDYQPFSFTVLKGSLSDEDRRKSNLLGNAIGGLW